MKNIITKKYELRGIRGIILSDGRRAQIATRSEAYTPDRLYAWRGRHDAPTWEAIQGKLETNREFA